MAVLKRIVPNSPLTTFQQPVDPGPGVFSVLATAAEATFDIFDPIATYQAEQAGAAEGYGAVGEYRPIMPGVAGAADGSMFEFAMGEDLRPSQDLVDVIGGAVTSVLGEGARVSFSSGHRPGDEGSQHSTGHAGDFAVFRPDGTRLSWDSPETRLIFQAAAASGALGFGAGPNYMGGNSFHVDLGLGGPLAAARGGVQVWSDDDGAGTSSGGPGAAEWLADLQAAYAGANPGAGVARPDAPPAPGRPGVQIRTERGDLELRDPDIFTSRYDMIRMQAASGAYSSRLLLDAQSDFMRLRQAHLLDPEGFMESSDAYIRQLVDSAPSMIRTELTMDLAAEARRQYDGIVSAQHTDILNRASNESAALADRYSEQYTTLLAQGDTAGAERVREQLVGVLRYRESIPGISWTRAQSENVLIRAQGAAETERTRIETERTREMGDVLEQVREFAEQGMIHESEGTALGSPEYMSHPDFEQTLVTTQIRDQTPGLLGLPPQQLQALARQTRAEATSATWEIAAADAMDNIATYQAEGLASDPIAFAQQNFAGVPGLGAPPQIPVYDGTNGTEVAHALAQRATYSHRMRELGYTQSAQFFSEAERQQMAAMISPEADLETRIGLVETLMQASPRDAMAMASEVEANQLVMHTMGIAIQGGSPEAIRLAMTGEAMDAAGQTTRPESEHMVLETLLSSQDSSNAEGFLAALPANPRLRGILMEVTTNIAYSQSGGAQPTGEGMMEALNIALGYRENGNAPATGGVQEVLGGSTLLTPDLSATDVTEAIDLAYRQAQYTIDEPVDGVFVVWRSDLANPVDIPGFDEAFDQGRLVEFYAENGVTAFTSIQDANAYIYQQPQASAMWGQAGEPYFAGDPIGADNINDFRLAPFERNGRVQAGYYTLVIDTANGPQPAQRADGSTYVLNLRELTRAARVSAATPEAGVMQQIGDGLGRAPAAPAGIAAFGEAGSAPQMMQPPGLPAAAPDAPPGIPGAGPNAPPARAAQPVATSQPANPNWNPSQAVGEAMTFIGEQNANLARSLSAAQQSAPSTDYIETVVQHLRMLPQSRRRDEIIAQLRSFTRRR
jgi:hypothetical protein